MKHPLREQLRRVAPSPAGSAAIQQRLLAQPWWAAAFQVGLYRSTPREPATGDLLADLLARRAHVAVPARQVAGYGWVWIDENTRWRRRAFGILEPVRAPHAAANQLRVILVPGLAFDAQGGRLGQGFGHFDRLLARTKALLVGLCFENRLVEAVPMERHDIRMDAVATEKRMLYMPSAAAKLEQLIGAG